MIDDGRRSRRGFILSTAVSLVSLGARGAAKHSIPVAVPGRQRYTIFLGGEASASERWAAAELCSHIEQMTGISLPIESGAAVPASRRAIAVGQSALTEACGVKPPEGEACLLQTVGETVVIAGGRQRGTMYGVSVLLEKLGCRWFTDDVASIPQMRDLWLPEFNETHRPAFDYREVFFTEAQSREWSARNRLNGHFHHLDEAVGGRIVYMPFAHSFYDLVPPARFFGSHPEYFALVNGKRQGERAQLCLTNAEVLRLAAEQADRWLTENPDASIISVSQNDSGGWCECGPCRQAVREEAGAISGLALRFVNGIAERLAHSHAGKLVDMLAYRQTADPPAVARPLSNVQIRLCPIDACQAHSFETCTYNQRSRKRLDGWSRIAPKLVVWQYSINFSHYLLPFPNLEELASDIPLFHRAGVSGMFIEGGVSDGGGSDDADLRSYLAARLLWNPNLDAATEIRDFLNAVYGPAAPSMLKYHSLRQREVRRGNHLWIDQNVDAPYLTREFLIQGRALLQSAAKRAATEAARRRVSRQLLSLDYVETVRAKRCVLQSGWYGPADPVRVGADTKSFLAKAEQLGITHLREGYPLAKQASDWSDVASRYALVILNDETTEAVLVPELEARIISLGRPNLLRVPDPGEWGYPHVGGIWISLYEAGQSTPQAIVWRMESPDRNSVTLAGTADSGASLQLQVLVASNSARVRAVVTNQSQSTVRLHMICRAEFAGGASHEASLRYQDQSGRERQERMLGDADGGQMLSKTDLPKHEWTLSTDQAKSVIRHRFETDQVEHCLFSWSFRNPTGLSVNLSLRTPEMELASGQQFALASEYDWKSITGQSA